MVKVSECSIDTTSRNILLAMGMEEGLISPLGFADDYAEGIKTQAFPKWAKQQVLEQVVLSPQLFCFESTGWGTLQAWQGPLIDENVLTEVKPKKDFSVSHREVPFEAYLGILRARGDKRRMGAVSREFEKVGKLLEEYDQLLQQYPDLHNRAHVAKLRKRLKRMGINAPIEMPGKHAISGLPAKALMAYERLNRLLSALGNKSAGSQDFMSGLLVAKERNCLLRCPLQPPVSGGEAVDSAPVMKGLGQEEIVLLRFTAERLGRTPIRPTLKETLLLARSAPAARLREMLGEWLIALNNGEEQVFQEITKDLALAQKGLRSAGRAGRAGSWTTWLAVPTGVAEIWCGSPGLIGMSLGVIGAGADAQKRRLEKKHRWAMFGAL